LLGTFFALPALLSGEIKVIAIATLWAGPAYSPKQRSDGIKAYTLSAEQADSVAEQFVYGHGVHEY